MQKNRQILAIILFLMSLGSSMYGIFLPIYFLKLGVPFREVIFLLLSYAVGGMLSGVFGNIVIHKTGVKFFIVLRGILEPVLILLFRFYPLHKYPLPLAGLMYGFVAFAFWISMDVFTAKSIESGSRGRQQSRLYSAVWLAQIFAPFIGGAIIKTMGYPVMFSTAVFFLIIGGIMSFFIKIDANGTSKINFIPTLKGGMGKIMAMTVVRGFSYAIASYLLGVYIYQHFASEVVVGSFGLFFGIASLLATIVTGHLIDKFHNGKVLVSIFLGIGVMWIILSLSIPAAILPVFIILTVFFYTGMSVPLNTVFFNQIKEEDNITLCSERMIAVCAGQVPVLLCAMFFSFEVLFVIAAVSAFAAIPIALRQQS